MTIPIIISAFGTTSRAIATYEHLNGAIRNHFPEDEIIWAYSSKVITEKLQKRETTGAVHPEQVLQQLERQGGTQAVVQSLHLFPGGEFHALHSTTRKSSLRCTTGMPLLTSPRDYHDICELLQPIIKDQHDKAILVLGHGTDHQTWTAYYTLEKILRQKYGNRVFVGVVQHYPDSTHLVDEIANQGFKEVFIIPFFLVAGFHFRRDIIGPGKDSWKSRIEQKQIIVESLDSGLGLLPGLERVVIRHIEEAKTKLLNDIK